MSNHLKDWKLIKGCYTPKDVKLKNKYIQLAKIFAPSVYFDPAEIFFPVDLPSTVSASSLYKDDGKPYPAKPTLIKSNINSSDFNKTDNNYFTTILGWGHEVRLIGKPPKKIELPIPKIQDIHKEYSTGKIPAKLTMYATICKPKEVPNYDFLEKYNPRIGLSALEEGLLLNYYFYFPAMVSPDDKREGDWSGISILFETKSIVDNNNVTDKKFLKALLEDRKGVWTCYYRKMGDLIIGYDIGMRRWDQVRKVKDLVTGLNTHPKVYISNGRHNCYYEPVTTKISITPKQLPHSDAGKIEKGEYTPPESNTVTGSTDLAMPGWAYVLFPFMLFFEACGAVCKFDGSGLKGGYQDVSDSVKPGGYEAGSESTQKGKPSSSDDYPSGKPSPGKPVSLKLNLVYVDHYDKVMKETWKYKGFWGAAEVDEYNYWLEDSNGKKVYHKSRWGEFKGFERPNLSSWFMWNLYWNTTYGSGP